MELVLHFVCENSVLLLNGSFVQSATAVRYDEHEPLYVTVLPLEAVYLPYTAEIMGGKAVTCQGLCMCCDMGDGHHYIELKPRSAYVYAPPHRPAPENSASAPVRLLLCLREGNTDAARALLSPALSESVSDEALLDFFEGVLAVRENVYTPQKGYLLLKSDGTAPRCEITLKDGLIENIEM